jgi:hypothetical protein
MVDRTWIDSCHLHLCKVWTSIVRGCNALPDEDLPCVATEMALHVLAYNLTRVMNFLGIQPLMAAMRA